MQFSFSPIAGVTEGLVAFAVTSNFADSLILCVVGGLLVAAGQIVVAIITTREAVRQRDAIEEAKELNRQNRRLLHDIAAAGGIMRRKTDHAPSPDPVPTRRSDDRGGADTSAN